MVWRKWIKYKGIPAVAVALGVSYETVRGWVNDNQTPKDKTKIKLVKMAKGEFGVEDFFKEGGGGG